MVLGEREGRGGQVRGGSLRGSLGSGRVPTWRCWVVQEGAAGPRCPPELGRMLLGPYVASAGGTRCPRTRPHLTERGFPPSGSAGFRRKVKVKEGTGTRGFGAEKSAAP